MNCRNNYNLKPTTYNLNMATTKTIKTTRSTSSVQAKASVKKPVAKKVTEKAVAKPIVKKEVVAKADSKVSLTTKVFDLKGAQAGTVTLPAEVFGVKPNKTLIAQAVRVYLANQRQGNASTKTRSEVTGSRKKVWRQKGTGRARHGSITGPIFVGGGITFGPRPHDFSLEMPKRMKKAALHSALSEKLSEGKVTILDGEFTGKTKQIAQALKSLGFADKKGKANKVLFIMGEEANVRKGAFNIGGLTVQTTSNLGIYPVVICKNIVITKSSIENFVSKKKTN